LLTNSTTIAKLRFGLKQHKLKLRSVPTRSDKFEQQKHCKDFPRHPCCFFRVEQGWLTVCRWQSYPEGDSFGLWKRQLAPSVINLTASDLAPFLT